MSQWTHPICEDCWSSLHPGREASRIVEQYRVSGRCCYCGDETVSGIYVREDPRMLPAHSEHAE